jgi:ribosomal protein S27AE
MSHTSDRLSLWAAEARAQGLSYGQYVAQFHPTLPPPVPSVRLPTYTKTCPECGRVFQAFNPRKVYCGETCADRVHNRKRYEKIKGDQ